MLKLEFSNRQSALAVDTEELNRLLAELFLEEGVAGGEVSVAIVSDSEIHLLNKKYLDHDYPTDVLSFVLDRERDELFGQIIASSETAIASCDDFGWTALNELTLYVIHGALHLVGYQDKTHADIAQMRAREQYYLARFGVGTSSGTSGLANKSRHDHARKFTATDLPGA